MTAIDRAVLMTLFLKRCGLPEANPKMLAGDASFRRYFRLDDPKSVIMDAPPGLEDIRPFIAIAQYLKSQGFSAPEIRGIDLDDGFLLLEDLGDDTFTRLLTAGSGPSEQALYEAAVDVLVDLHTRSCPTTLPIEGTDPYALPPYDAELLLKEASLFPDWYYREAVGQPCPDDARKAFVDLWTSVFPQCAPKQPVLVLRDYHADNLMWLPDREGSARVGLLDFQDGVIGHAAYDLVSLLEDARRDVPPALAEAMIARYVAAAGVEDGPFRDAYAALGAQRNTKIIGIFTRLWKRDGKPHYLKMIPRVWRLLERDLEHPALSTLKVWFDEYTPKSLRTAVLEAHA